MNKIFLLIKIKKKNNLFKPPSFHAEEFIIELLMKFIIELSE